MAGKEATVYIVDVGSTMREISCGRSESNFDWAMRYVWDKLTTTIATGRKTLLSGIVALRSEETINELSDDENYEHIAVLNDLAQLQMPEFRKLRSQLVVGSQQHGDIVSALVIAIHMITQTCKHLAYQRRIFLVTDARATVETDNLPEIASKLKEDHIELTVLGVDFDDADYGFKEEEKDPIKNENEEILRQLCKDANGTFGTVAQAVDELTLPRIKAVKPVPSYRGYLTLGDSHQYNDAFNINVERYPKTMIAKPPSASRYVIRSNLEATQSSATLSMGDGAPEDDLAAIKNARTYQIVDKDAPGGKREIEAEQLAKGYEYGRTAVHISESDQNVTAFETPQGLDIIGFVDAKQYERYFDMSRTNVIVPERANNKASMALSSFIHALYELESYAVARFVAKENKPVYVVLLSPYIEPDFECLYEVELPFAEDVRSYKFPPLDRVMTVSGKSITVHRNIPSSDLQKAMDDYVDSMDLSTADQDENGRPAEYMQLDEAFSPVLHHLNHVIRQRAIYPEREPPEPALILTKYSQPPANLVKSSKDTLSKVISLADVKRVPPKARGKRYGKKEEKPLSDLDVAALLASDPKRKQRKIDPANAVPEFKQIINAASSVEELHDACKQLQKIIVDWTKHSVGDSNHGKVVEAMRVMRDEMNDLEEPAPYNDFMQDFKRKLFNEELGGNRRDLWFVMRVSKQVGLISKRDCEISTVSDEDAAAFMSAR